MSDFFNDFLNNLEQGLIALVLYMAAFFVLYAIIRRNTANDLKNFTLAEPRTGFFGKDFRLELSYFLINKTFTDIVIAFLSAILTITILDRYFPYHTFANTVEYWPFWAQVFIGCIIADAAFFFPHWFSHKFLWRFHSIHHSAEELSWLTAIRLHPVDQIPFAIGGIIFMHLFGFEGQSIIAAILLHNSYNLFVHANLNLDYPKPLCYILGSPNYHRWHHAAEKAAIDKNFATMFPVFDVIFGSYYYPHDRLPERYGLYGSEQAVFPRTLRGQLLYPFMKRKDGAR